MIADVLRLAEVVKSGEDPQAQPKPAVEWTTPDGTHHAAKLVERTR